MTFTEFLEKCGKTVFEKPLSGGTGDSSPREFAEIRLAALDEVRRKSYRAGARKVFPFELIRVSLRGVEQADAELFRGAFFRQYLEQEVHTALRADGCRFPPNLRIEVEAAVGLPQRGESWLLVEASSPHIDAGSATQAARLVVRSGSANVAELPLTKPRTHIGREIDVYRNQGLHRRNDLAFVDETDINRSVSREHAHIRYHRPTGEYRLFNDRWYERGTECGTWIVRDGLSREVHRDSRGVRLEPGDEIHFGRAVVVFELP
ncbi:MAG TPA: FHA domain-containing protein [Candidatus Acidoferrales bacterium]|nr:FHA domain-containing protein [Candidatus Acidoferrales bacterium]